MNYVLIKIEANEDGSHNYQEIEGLLTIIPDGYAYFRKGDVVVPSIFPYVEVIEIGGRVIELRPRGVITFPEPEPKAQDVLLELVADQEYRLCMLELGL